MPPKVKLTKEMLTDAALELARKEGVSAVGIRSLAAFVGCSTQPVLSNFASADALRQEVLDAAYRLYERRTSEQMRSGKYPEYKASGMAYIAFAREEPRLFSALFMREGGAGADDGSFIEGTIIPIIMKNLGLPPERARLFHLEMWTFVHGVAVMSATSYFTPTEEMISEMLTDVYLGTAAYHKEKNKNEND